MTMKKTAIMTVLTELCQIYFEVTLGLVALLVFCLPNLSSYRLRPRGLFMQNSLIIT